MRLESLLFGGLLALPLLATLPKGSVSDGAILTLSLTVFGMTLLYLAHLSRPYLGAWLRPDRRGRSDAQASMTILLQGRLQGTSRWPLAIPALLLLLALYIWLQTLPLPGWLSPLLGPDTRQPWISVDRHETRLHALLTLAFACYSYLLLQLVSNRRRLRWLAYSLVVTGLLQASYGTFMTLSGLEYGFFSEKAHGRGLATGTYVNRNHMAGLLEMSLGIAIGLLVGASGRGEPFSWRNLTRAIAGFVSGSKGLLRLASVIMVIALVMTHSRMGNTAFFASLLVVGILYMALRRRFNKGTLILLVSILLIDIAIVGNWFGIERVIQRLEATGAQIEQGREARVPVSEFNWLLAKDHWLTGVGSGGYRHSIPQYLSDDIGGFRHAHNDYLEIWIEHGLIGASLFALIAGIGLVSALCALRKRHDPTLVGVGYGASMGLFAIALHSGTDFNLQIPANALIFLTLIVMAWLALHLPSRQRAT